MHALPAKRPTVLTLVNRAGSLAESLGVKTLPPSIRPDSRQGKGGQRVRFPGRHVRGRTRAPDPIPANRGPAQHVRQVRHAKGCAAQRRLAFPRRKGHFRESLDPGRTHRRTGLHHRHAEIRYDHPSGAPGKGCLAPLAAVLGVPPPLPRTDAGDLPGQPAPGHHPQGVRPTVQARSGPAHETLHGGRLAPGMRGHHGAEFLQLPVSRPGQFAELRRLAFQRGRPGAEPSLAQAVPPVSPVRRHSSGALAPEVAPAPAASRGVVSRSIRMRALSCPTAARRASWPPWRAS